MDEHTHIIGNCPDCGQMRIPVEAVTIRGCPDRDQWSYRFTCPGCGITSVAPTTEGRALQAIEIGAALETWHDSRELHEQHEGPVLTLIDSLELHRELDEPDWFEKFLAAGAHKPA
jgi:hypothetical protein